MPLKKIVSLLILIIFSQKLISQNTVGVISYNQTDTYNGLTLFTSHTETFLINSCGEVVNQWTSAYPPGNSVYLLPNGNLLRAGQVTDGSSNITFGGQGGVIELFNWDGDLIWSYLYNSNNFRQHHDIYPMPNGNILILAVTTMTVAEAINAGRDPNQLNDTRFYNERIFEVEPIGTNQINVVWDWNVKDHLIQDFDITKDNFGNVAMTPGKLDINFLNGGFGGANWLHFNSIQYDENLNQIVISSRNLSEIYIIDHSTTITESATSTGGIYGKGGDFLYRWGNPQSYRQGTEADRILYGQHFPHYIKDGFDDQGKIIVFNNGFGRSPNYSEVLIFNPPVSDLGFYSYTPGTAFEPISAEYSYSDQSTIPSEFYSAIVSSAQKLANGNTLICEGRTGEIFEIDTNDNIVWKYQNPVSNTDGSIYNQGDNAPITAILFRAIKYGLDYPAFTGRDLTPGDPIELNSGINDPCDVLSTEEFLFQDLTIYPNPATDIIKLNSKDFIDNIEIYNSIGALMNQVNNTNQINVANYASGIYFLRISSKTRSVTKKIIKQ